MTVVFVFILPLYHSFSDPYIGCCWGRSGDPDSKGEFSEILHCDAGPSEPGIR